MKRFFTGILKRNSNGTSYLLRSEDDAPVNIRRLSIKTDIQSGMRVIVQGTDNGRIIEVERIMTWPYPKKEKKSVKSKNVTSLNVPVNSAG